MKKGIAKNWSLLKTENQKRTEGFLISLLGVLLLLTIIPFAGYAAVPQTINYQGYLTSSTGQPVNGTVSIVFSLYDVQTSGTALWTETQPTVQVNNGVYSVILGSVNPINLAFDVQYYLGVKVGADAEMTPRQPLTSVPYAMKAGTADSVPDSVITTTMIQDGAVTDAKITGPITGSKLGTHSHSGSDITSGTVNTARLDVGTTAGTVATGDHTHNYDSNYVNTSGDTMTGTLTLPSNGLVAGTNQLVLSAGNVGIGTTLPSSKLTIDSGDLRINNGYFFQFNDIGMNQVTKDVLASNYYTGAGYSEARIRIGNKGAADYDNLDSFLSFSVYDVPSWSLLETMRLVDGNVGIGTTSPGAKLEVAGQVKITGGTPGAGKVLTSDANGLATWETGAGGGSSISAGDSNVTVTDEGDGHITFTEDNAEKMRITGGNVCIGCTLPGGIKLRVAGGNIALVAGASGSIQLAHNPADDGGCSFNYNSPKLSFWGCVGNVTGPSIQKVDRGLGYGKGDLVFYQHQTDDTSGEYEAMRLTYDGNVGIGTASPSAKLDVAGRIKSQNSRGQVKGNSYISTNSQTWTDMPGMSLSITTGASDILISLVIGGLRQSGNFNLGYFRILLDGTEIWQTEAISEFAYPNQVAASQYESVSAGSHTITVQWRVGNSSDTISAGANTSTRNLTVIELF